MLDVGRSFSFPFRAPRWVGRTLVGAVLEIVPLLLVIPFLIRIFSHHARPSLRLLGLMPVIVLAGLLVRFVLIGYFRRIAANVFAGDEAGLPPWDQFDRDLVEGFKLWLVALGLILPAIGIALALGFLVMAVCGTSCFWIPLVIVGPPALIATLLYVPAGLLATVREGEMSAAFDPPRALGNLGAMIGPYLLAFLVWIASHILAQFGLILLCAGIFATRFLANCISVHAFASAYLEGFPPLAPGEAAPSTLIAQVDTTP